MLNNVNLIGRVTKEIELRKTQSNKSVVKFTLAVDDGKDGQGNSKTQFIDCQAWEGLAETIQKYVLKGDMVNINGKLINNNYESNGVKYYSYLVLASGMTLLPNKRLNEQKPQQVANQVTNQYEPQYNEPQYEPQYQQQSIRPDGRNVTGGLDYSDIKPDDLPFY